jgi:DNA-binding transcriptional regulator YiaG
MFHETFTLAYIIGYCVPEMANCKQNQSDTGDARRYGLELRRLRRALDLKQTEVAARAKCAQASVHRAESGSKRISPSLLKRIAKVLIAAGAKAKAKGR